MGRVLDAIRRANADDQSDVQKRRQADLERRRENPNAAPLPSAKQIEERLPISSSFTPVSHETEQSSASSAHTADMSDGLALPVGMASRDVGATLGAAGAARVGGYATYDISPTRVEPHLIAVSQPRSP